MEKSVYVARFNRRQFLQKGLLTFGLWRLLATKLFPSAQAATFSPETKLASACHTQVHLLDGAPDEQLKASIKTLLSLSNDSLLKPFRELTQNSQADKGENLGGWYAFNPNYDWRAGSPSGFAPGHSFGQWLSALSRAYASSNDVTVKNKIDSLIEGYSETIGPLFFKDARFPAYTYDKLVIGLVDAHRYAHSKQAVAALEKTTEAALPYLPVKAIDRLVEVPGRDASYTWDESYTLPENLFIAYQNGFGQRYLELAKRFLLDETFFGPLSKGQNVLVGKHAYSYMNALSSAAQAHLFLKSEMHLQAALNAFAMIEEDQSYATGGWGPDELFQKPGTGFLLQGLSKSHHSFETPCGAYAHLKLMNYLTCITGQSRFGDSAERVLYNTVLGAKPLQSDGHAFYYADYNNEGKKIYSEHIFPCCAGTLPQVASDYAKHAYYLDNQGVYISLYINSAIDFEHEGEKVRLEQKHCYPQSDSVTARLMLKCPGTFSVRMRIPTWVSASDVHVLINGEKQSLKVEAGTFLSVTRIWSDGDAIELVLPQTLRVLAIDEANPQVVALLSGSRVLFASGKVAPRLTKAELLRSRRVTSEHWVCMTEAGEEVSLLPYTAIGDEPYKTYFDTV
jgi:DUF1680 family protein